MPSHSIHVIATSTDGSTSNQNFTIFVGDNNTGIGGGSGPDDDYNLGAISDMDATLSTVSENAIVGTLVGITAFTEDLDTADAVTYALSATDIAAGLFAIDAFSGVVTLSGNLDFEAAPSHNINVIATSKDGSTSNQNFTINVGDNNTGIGGGTGPDDDFNLGAISDTDATLSTESENAIVGTVVGITAFAEDLDTADSVTYTLSAADIAAGAFAIDATSGVVTLSGNLDFEAAPSHNINVIATSTDRSTSNQNFTISVGDNNTGIGGGTGPDDDYNVGAISDMDATLSSVSENAILATAVGISAFAEDLDTADTVTYTLSATDIAAGLFVIDTMSGVVTLSGNLDFEVAPSHNINVIATSTDGSTSNQTFTINVGDNNTGIGGGGSVVDHYDVGVVSDTDITLSNVSENALLGTTVGITVFADDLDVADTVTYALSALDTAAGIFAIDTNNGVVTLINNLDYETATSHTINVTATSTDGSSANQNFVINVADGNAGIGGTGGPDDDHDISAISDMDDNLSTVSENAALGTIVGITAFAEDLDTADSVTYTLSAADIAAGLFTVDADNGVVTLIGNLNFETATTHTINVIATSTDNSTSNQDFIINVGDDNTGIGGGFGADDDDYISGVSDTDSALSIVSENAVTGTEVAITAFANDLDTADTVIYTLSSGDITDGLFAINSSTGVVTLIGDLDFQVTTSHTINVIATSTDGSSSNQDFVIDVGDDNTGIGGGGGPGNDFLVGAISDTDSTVSTVSENAVVGTVVGITALAIDADALDSVSYSLNPAGITAGLFAIDASSGVVTLIGNLDFETAISHTLNVIATSTDGSTSSQNFMIDVADDDTGIGGGVGVDDDYDVSVVSDTDPTLSNVSENALSGTAIGISAFANDLDDADTVTYALSAADTAAGLFAIDANNGVVTLIGNLDYETATSHTINVTATSTDGSNNNQNFVINVTDGNTGIGGIVGTVDDDYDISIISDMDDDLSTVSENAATGTVVGITAFAEDLDTADTVSYTLSVTDITVGLFAIDATSGVVTLIGNLNFETMPSHNINVIATSTDGSTSNQSFTINVGDGNSGIGGGIGPDDYHDVGEISDTDLTVSTVSENAIAGTVVGITAFAVDADALDSVSYTLSPGDVAAGLFAIDATTGIVTLAGNLDFELLASHTVNVIATSMDGSTSNQNFTVNVGDDNTGIGGGSGLDDDHDVGEISDTDLTVSSVSENAIAGTVVGITALAVDGDSADTVSYTLSPADITAGLFAIDGTTGIVTLAGNLDFEVLASHTINVIATSTDGSTSNQNFTVNVADDNTGIGGGSGLDDDHDVGVISDTDLTVSSVSENAIVGTVVGITALAVDADAADTVSYTLSPADVTEGLFAIDGTTGIVTLAGNLDFEALASHTINVIATSTDGSTSNQNFTVNVADDNTGIGGGSGPDDDHEVGAINDADVTVSTVSENAIVGTVVGITALAEDADAADTVTYTLSPADVTAGLFAIDGTTGIVTLAGNLNFEVLANHTFNVIATSTDGSASNQNFTINVGDDNTGIGGGSGPDDDHEIGAISDTDLTLSTVSENAIIGTVVGITALAEDADAADTVSYTLSPGDVAAGLFAIDGTTGIVTLAGNLDFEALASHTLNVIATSTDGSTSSQNFIINVGDDNTGIGGGVGLDDDHDIGAIGDTDLTLSTVSENATVGTVVGITAFAEDADAADTVSYTLSPGDVAAGLFAIDGTTGIVTLAGNLDFEALANHTLNVIATSADGSTSTQNFTVNVGDDNTGIGGGSGLDDDHDIGAISDTDVTVSTVSENAIAGKVVGITALAVDVDAADTVSYTLSPADVTAGLFAIDGTTGIVTLAGNLDFEVLANHTLNVIATSTDGSTSTQNFTVNVGDDNTGIGGGSGPDDDHDIGAITDTDLAVSTVSENAIVDTVVGITALADDVDAADTVSYTLSAADVTAGLFAIDVTTGVVTLIGSLDFEALASHTINVIATSTDGSTSNQNFTVNVGDDNTGIGGGSGFDDDHDVGVISDTDLTVSTVSENAIVGTVVGITALAVDADAADTVSYTLSPADVIAGLFAIDGTSGIITLAGNLDFEALASHTINVIATSTDGSTSNQNFIINVGDDNAGTGGGSGLDDDHDVSVINDTDLAVSTVSENAIVGTVVGITALAVDADAADTVSYTLSPADVTAGLFAIDGTTGIVTLAGNLDFEVLANHTLNVIATSTDGSASNQNFTINVGDDNTGIGGGSGPDDDHDIGAISDTDLTVSTVSENAIVGTVVGITALAEDADAADTVSYTLSPADFTAGLFAIDGTTGIVTLAGNLDFEVLANHTLNVIANSTDGSTSNQNFTVNVADDNTGIGGGSGPDDDHDIGAISDTDITVSTVSENAIAGTVVGITALADDADAADTVRYTLSPADVTAGLFAIDVTSGVVTLIGSLDFEALASHTINVIATSTDGSTSNQNFTVNVGDDNTGIGGGSGFDDDHDVGVISDADVTVSSVSENAVVGTVVGITALAEDADAADTVSYILSPADVTAGLFAIDGTTGIVTLAGNLDFEVLASHTINVTAVSTDGSSANQNFVIHVADDNAGIGGTGGTDDDHDISAISDTDVNLSTVSENAALGTVVGITAFAEDLDSTDSVTYTLSTLDITAGLFTIDENSGVVTLIGNLDFETAINHTLNVVATSTDGSTSNQGFTINVGDDNTGIGGGFGADDDHDISGVSDIDSEVSTVSENAVPGTEVAITGFANDLDLADTVIYTLSASDITNGLFSINSSTGVVTLMGNLDFEVTTSHTINVIATSTDGSSSNQNFVINVGDDNTGIGGGGGPDNDFVVGPISDTDSTVSTVSENAVVGSVVGITALANDADAADTVSYSLSPAGLAAGLFAIDTSSGVVTLIGNLDFEAAPSHSINVIATSTDGSTTNQNFVVDVGDDNTGIGGGVGVDDDYDVSVVSDTDITLSNVSENALVTTAVGITAFADDLDIADTVTYALSATDTTSGLFAIDASNGVVTLIGNLDYETATSHTINVTATSTDGSSNNQNFVINVADNNTGIGAGAGLMMITTSV